MTLAKLINTDFIFVNRLNPGNQRSILRIKTPNSALYLHYANNQ